MRAMMRLDQALVERGLLASREQAQRAVMAGNVQVNGRPATKPGARVKPDDEIRLAAPERFVSRGGQKLEHALASFGFEIAGRCGVDIGASTGGFTDCLLQRGAAQVFAVDVGQGLLAWKLRQDPRVVVMERVNARHLNSGHFPSPFTPLDFAVIDCSFISLRLVLPPVVGVLRRGGDIVALVKPQFEAGKAEADRGRGVIRDAEVHARVLRELEAFVAGRGGIRWQGCVESPILGGAGNKEFLVWLEKTE
ncbi:MAG: TlyA family RNA methyltransferase [Verrucomicrobiales bacterium]|nr:TlyA family RNA methyltransferase [Verrucomicrobiales bacterium]MCP5525669.1 TlyA family RNA methyltransferase [Verrucomicrobiales bacterium]